MNVKSISGDNLCETCYFFRIVRFVRDENEYYCDKGCIKCLKYGFTADTETYKNLQEIIEERILEKKAVFCNKCGKRMKKDDFSLFGNNMDYFCENCSFQKSISIGTYEKLKKIQENENRIEKIKKTIDTLSFWKRAVAWLNSWQIVYDDEEEK